VILVAVGTQFPFDRLVKTVDDWAGVGEGRKIVAQIGRTSLAPRHLEAYASLEPSKFQSLLEGSDLVIAHCGMGSILSALSLGKPIIVMPRSAAKGEHRNDHQFSTAKRFAGFPGLTVAWDEAELRRSLDQFAKPDQGGERPGSIPPKAPHDLTDRLRAFLNGDA
jgi:UDP-N-acetylglucosamine transferase subunit ALG13